MTAKHSLQHVMMAFGPTLCLTWWCPCGRWFIATAESDDGLTQDWFAASRSFYEHCKANP